MFEGEQKLKCFSHFLKSDHMYHVHEFHAIKLRHFVYQCHFVFY